MKFNQVAVLAAAAILLPLGGAITYFTSTPRAAVAQPEQSLLLAQASDTPVEEKGEKRGGRGHSRLFEQLDLSDAQKAEIQKIRQEARESGSAQREEARAAREKMRELFASDASADELRAQHQASQELRQALHDQHFEVTLKMREVLTPEQRAKLAELKPERRGRRGPQGPQGDIL
jgi:periplasmic protein CpxP/Spy